MRLPISLSVLLMIVLAHEAAGWRPASALAQEAASSPPTESPDGAASQKRPSLEAAYEHWAQSQSGPVEASGVTLRDDFDGRFSLLWNIVRADLDHISLETHEGELTIVTQLGNIHGSQNRNPARNLLLTKNPLGSGDFTMTMKINQFQPQTHYQQVGLLCYDDDDNYLKWDYEFSWRPGKGKNFGLVLETEMKAEHDFNRVEDLEDLWLRVTKRVDSYECAFSRDGDEFEVLGERTFSTDSPKYLGIVAKNGGNKAAGEIEARIDWFEVVALEPSEEETHEDDPFPSPSQPAK